MRKAYKADGSPVFLSPQRSLCTITNNQLTNHYEKIAYPIGSALPRVALRFG